MAKLIYFTLISLDGHIEDETGKFDWAVPDDDVHAFANDLVRGAGTFLYGRRMYETMKAWQSAEPRAPVHEDFAAIWRAADKIVFSTTVKEPATPNTRVERKFEASAVRQRRIEESFDGIEFRYGGVLKVNPTMVWTDGTGVRRIGKRVGEKGVDVAWRSTWSARRRTTTTPCW